MATLAQIEELEKRRAAVAKQISAAKKSLRNEERDADKHVKIALGGAALAFFASRAKSLMPLTTISSFADALAITLPPGHMQNV